MCVVACVVCVALTIETATIFGMLGQYSYMLTRGDVC